MEERINALEKRITEQQELLEAHWRTIEKLINWIDATSPKVNKLMDFAAQVGNTLASHKHEINKLKIPGMPTVTRH